MQLFVKDRHFYTSMVSLAAPIALQGLINFGVNMADTVMLGKLGETVLSGSALANQFCFLFLILNFGLGGGAGVLTGQFWGKGDREAIAKTMSIVLKLTSLFAFIFFLAAQLFPETIMRFYTTEPGVILQGSRFLRIISISFFFQGVSTVSATILRTVGTVKLPLITTLITFVNNVILNWVFIYGNLGAPRLETAGSALATTVSRVLEFIVVVVFLMKYDTKIQFRPAKLKGLDGHILSSYLKIGAPVIVSDLLLALGMNMLSAIMGRMGTEMVAANSIMNVVWNLTTILLMGIANASGIVTGNTVGAGEFSRAQQYGVTFVSMSFCIGAVAAIIIFLLKRFAVDFYNVTDLTKQTAYQLMNAVSVIAVFIAMNFTLTKGVLRAGGDTRFLMVADVLFLWIVSVPLGYVAGLVLHLPPGIVFLCLKADEILKSILCLIRLAGKKWIRSVSHAGLPDGKPLAEA